MLEINPNEAAVASGCTPGAFPFSDFTIDLYHSVGWITHFVLNLFLRQCGLKFITNAA
jgi:hypothetical protein